LSRRRTYPWPRRGMAVVLLILTACGIADDSGETPSRARGFPRAWRPVAAVAGVALGSENIRDNRGEARLVMDLASIREGTTVADIGAGEGYYTVRLAERVGARGRVLAQDIDQAAIQNLGQRVVRERLDNVSIIAGTPADPRLPEHSFDRIFMIHVYSEIKEPYAFLWHLRPALRPGGQVVVVDRENTTSQQGIEPALLFCEFGALGFHMVAFVRKPEWNSYYAAFEAMGDRPVPRTIRPCIAAKRKMETS